MKSQGSRRKRRISWRWARLGIVVLGVLFLLLNSFFWGGGGVRYVFRCEGVMRCDLPYIASIAMYAPGVIE